MMPFLSSKAKKDAKASIDYRSPLSCFFSCAVDTGVGSTLIGGGSSIAPSSLANLGKSGPDIGLVR